MRRPTWPQTNNPQILRPSDRKGSKVWLANYHVITNIIIITSCYRNRAKLRPCGPLSLLCDFTFTFLWVANYHIITNTTFPKVVNCDTYLCFLIHYPDTLQSDVHHNLLLVLTTLFMQFKCLHLVLSTKRENLIQDHLIQSTPSKCK